MGSKQAARPVPNQRRQELPIRTAVPTEQGHAMELYACGFNALNQLAFEQSMEEDEPDDMFLFTRVLSARKISQIQANMAYTILHRNGVPLAAPRYMTFLVGWKNKNGKFGRLPAVAGDGVALDVKEADSRDGGAAASQTLVRSVSLEAWANDTNVQSWPCKSPIRQIEAYDAGFVILSQDRESPVSTMGDARFEDCLGRDVDKSSPASKPCPVSLLNSLGEPIKRITAGGFSLAALTKGGAAYIWGAQSTGSQHRHQPFPGISGIPNYTEVDGDKDVMDIALGESHGIAMTADKCVYVIGSNTNGQLGLSKNVDIATSWSKIGFEAPRGWEVVGVEAGPRSSFILTAKKKPY